MTLNKLNVAIVAAALLGTATPTFAQVNQRATVYRQGEYVRPCRDFLRELFTPGSCTYNVPAYSYNTPSYEAAPNAVVTISGLNGI